ncbi:MAG: hydantoinase B/oxoprolinase family protein, partial [Pseudomonadales bacterium]|nr:hydantoinase B/oxoprolinase family protein [Pseudomonadales bacterium]
ATQHMDGWHACGPLCCFGALSSGDVELLEYTYPIIIHRYGLVQDSAGAGRYRGGSGTAWEVEPLGHEMTVIGFGEGRQIPTMGAAGAYNGIKEAKLGSLVIAREEGTEMHKRNVMTTIQPGERAINTNPGGGGFGDPFKRPIEDVLWDVKNGLVSVEAALTEYGLRINGETLEVDASAREQMRANV